MKHRRILFTLAGHAKAECECGWEGRWHRHREDAKSEHGGHVLEAELDAIDEGARP